MLQLRDGYLSIKYYSTYFLVTYLAKMLLMEHPIVGRHVGLCILSKLQLPGSSHSVLSRQHWRYNHACSLMLSAKHIYNVSVVVILQLAIRADLRSLAWAKISSDQHLHSSTKYSGSCGLTLKFFIFYMFLFVTVNIWGRNAGLGFAAPVWCCCKDPEYV